MFVFSETINLSHLTNQQFNACENSVAFRSRETQITDISYTCAYVCTPIFVKTPRDNELPIKTKSLNANTAFVVSCEELPKCPPFATEMHILVTTK